MSSIGTLYDYRNNRLSAPAYGAPWGQGLVTSRPVVVRSAA